MGRKKKVQEKEKKLQKTLKEFHFQIRKQMATFITGAFSFVAALVWRDAIRSFLNTLIKTEAIRSLIHYEWLVDFITAILITLIAVVSIILVSKFLAPTEK